MRRTVSVEILENRTLLAAVPVIAGNGTTITNGDITPSQSDGTNFAWGELGGFLTRTYTIKNTGDANLTVSRPTISGANAADFSIVSFPTRALAPNAVGTMVLKFAPKVAGSRTATVDVHSNSSSVADYAFAVSGRGIQTISMGGGLRYGVVTAGTGDPLASGDLLTVDYSGWLRSTGAVFDSSSGFGGSHAAFDLMLGVGSVIPGWDRGLLGAKVGEDRVLFIPSALAYGKAGSGNTIPPNSNLIFETSVLSSISMQTWSAGISFAGQGQTIANHDATWSATDGTAFYSTGPAVTQNLIVDVNTSRVREVTGYQLTGPGAKQFSIGGITNISGEKYNFAVVYTPVAGKSSDAALSITVGGAKHPVFTYGVSLHGEVLAPGVTLAGGVLTAPGTAANDSISLSLAKGYYSLKTGNVTNHFNAAEVNSIVLHGGAGNDSVSVSSSVLHGVAVDGGDGRDVLKGGSGADTILGGTGDDVIYGNAGNDIVDGGDGSNRIYGGAGDDSLTGGAGNDTLDGGAGNDTLVGGPGNDLLIGGKDANAFYANDGDVRDILDTRGSTTSAGKWDEGFDIIRGGTLARLP